MFPDAAAAVPLSLVLHRKNDSSALGEDLRNYTWAIQDHVRQYCENTPGASGVVKAGGIAGCVDRDFAPPPTTCPYCHYCLPRRLPPTHPHPHACARYCYTATPLLNTLHAWVCCGFLACAIDHARLTRCPAGSTHRPPPLAAQKPPRRLLSRAGSTPTRALNPHARARKLARTRALSGGRRVLRGSIKPVAPAPGTAMPISMQRPIGWALVVHGGVHHGPPRRDVPVAGTWRASVLVGAGARRRGWAAPTEAGPSSSSTSWCGTHGTHGMLAMLAMRVHAGPCGSMRVQAVRHTRTRTLTAHSQHHYRCSHALSVAGVSQTQHSRTCTCPCTCTRVAARAVYAVHVGTCCSYHTRRCPTTAR